MKYLKIRRFSLWYSMIYDIVWYNKWLEDKTIRLYSQETDPTYFSQSNCNEAQAFVIQVPTEFLLPQVFSIQISMKGYCWLEGKI